MLARVLKIFYINFVYYCMENQIFTMWLEFHLCKRKIEMCCYRHNNDE
jgi:hypothetical protein